MSVDSKIYGNEWATDLRGRQKRGMKLVAEMQGQDVRPIVEEHDQYRIFC